jgi:hypothetical protein
MIPYGGNPVRPPSYRVDPPTPKEREQTRRHLVLFVLFVLGALCLLCVQPVKGVILLAAWYAVKRLWKDPYA